MLTEMSSNFALGSSAKKTSFLGCKTFQLMHISGSLDIKIAILWKIFTPKNPLFSHTVRKSHIVSKNSIFRKNDKIVNLNFCAKNQWISVIFKHWYLLEFEFSREKNGKIQLFSIFGNSVFPQNHDFWRENSNYPVNFPFENSKKSWLFSLKIQIQNLEFFWKIEFLDIIWNFLTLCWGCDVEAAEAAEAVKACSWGWW